MGMESSKRASPKRHKHPKHLLSSAFPNSHNYTAFHILPLPYMHTSSKRLPPLLFSAVNCETWKCHAVRNILLSHAIKSAHKCTTKEIGFFYLICPHSPSFFVNCITDLATLHALVMHKNNTPLLLTRPQHAYKGEVNVRMSINCLMFNSPTTADLLKNSLRVSNALALNYSILPLKVPQNDTQLRIFSAAVSKISQIPYNGQ